VLELACKPTIPLLSRLFPAPPLVEGCNTGTAVLGVTGDVGGLANGAELMECEPRLCEAESVRFTASLLDLRFVNVISTENCSPAKYEDCEGTTETRMGNSGSNLLDCIPRMFYFEELLQRGGV